MKKRCVINLMLGAALWCGLCGDWRWVSAPANVLFVVLATVIATATMLRKHRAGDGRWIEWLSALPSFIAGFWWVGVVVAMLPLAMFFRLSETQSAKMIGRDEATSSPLFAEAVFYPVGAYASGTGTVAIDLGHRFVPGVRKRIHVQRVREADENTVDALTWSTDNTLRFVDTDGSGVVWDARSVTTLPVAVWVLHRPMLSSTALWAPITGVACVITIGLMKRYLTLAQGLCPTCNYSLRANESGTCPECGDEIEHHGD